MNKPKLIAFYLPQYHEIPENNEWWGKGFTEWTNVKKAKPLYRNHYQPKLPLNDNFYNLLDDDTFSWQVELANKYGIDGFCFYHYWFNGKLLLQKPLENFLQRKDLNINYCFSWANEPWARTWDGKNKDVLMPQCYGGEIDIINHFDYMLPFFKDERYIKINNRPVFLLYRTSSITYLNEFIDIWNKQAIENGFDGIFFVETLNCFSLEKISDKTDSAVYFEPTFSVTQRNIFDKIIQNAMNLFSRNKNRFYSYSYVWNRVFKYQKIDEKHWGGAFVNWDNSSRKKKHYLILKKFSPHLFYEYLIRIFSICKTNNSPFLFINAWNEWAEGTYLEPDNKFEFKYLEIISSIVNEEEL